MPLSYLTYKLFVEPSVKIGKKIAEGIRDQALEEVEDTPEKLQREILDLQMSLEAEEISEAECQKKEKKILERLEALREGNSKVEKPKKRPRKKRSFYH